MLGPKKWISEKGVTELMVAVIVATLIIVLALALVPSLLNTITSEAQKDSLGQKKESPLCTGDNCTDCTPGDANCYTTSSTTTSTSGPGPGPGCFVGETPVLMADGTLKAIEEIWVGDYVMSMKEHGRGDLSELTVSKVRAVTVHQNLSVVRITLNGETIDTTEIHPFFVMGLGWVEARDLAIGDMMLSASGDAQVVWNMLDLEEKRTVYNLFIDKTNTFFVGKSLLWVHNINPTKFPGYS